MADTQKKNIQGKVEAKPSSIVDKKRQYILDELSILMEQADKDYSPFLMEELHQRLEFVVQNFNEELKSMIKSSFKEWQIKDSQLRDLMATNIDDLQDPKSQSVKEKPVDSSKPNFIKDMEFGPIRRK